VPRSLLPEVRPSISEFGRTKAVPGLADDIPILGIAGDQQAALFGQGCVEAGGLKNTKRNKLAVVHDELGLGDAV
jgi:glycerol kinase